MMSDVAGGLSAAASFAESWSSSAQTVSEFAHNFGTAGAIFGPAADLTSTMNGGNTLTQTGLNVGVGIAVYLGGPLLVIPGAQFYLFSIGTKCFYPGGTQQAVIDLGTSLNDMAVNGLGP
jgi:hypothetical protein